MSSKPDVDLMATLWESYQLDSYQRLLPAGQQHTECKRAFYGGAAKSLMALVHLASDDEQPTQADMDLITQLMEETSAFFLSETAIFHAQQH
jgi:hypothetical protein